jgi:hypothetical protein
MAEGSEVSLRKLPDGDVKPARECSWSGRYLELELLDDGDEFGIGALVEIETGEAIYLGEAQRRQGPRLWVAVEHSVDRGKLARIQESWNEADTAEAPQ